MQEAVPMFMQYGAMGILALGFIVLLVLFVRADKRSQSYADSLRDVDFDRTTLIQVVAENSKASTALAKQIERMGVVQDRQNAAIDKLVIRLENERSTFLKEATKHGWPEGKG